MATVNLCLEKINPFMKKEHLAGLIFIAILGIAFFQTIVSQNSKISRYPYRTKIYFSQIDGIGEGTEVTIRGVEAGLVLSIDIVPISSVEDRRHLEASRENAIELTLALSSPLTLWDNYQIRFNTKSVFSNRVIDIDPGSFSMPEPIYYQPTYQTDENTADFFPSARYIDNFFSAANTVITENQTDIRTIVTHSREITEKLTGQKGTLPRLVNTTEAYDELDTTLADLGILMREARRYQEANRKLEQTHPIPFMISFGFFGRTTVTGRYVEPITSIKNFP